MSDLQPSPELSRKHKSTEPHRPLAEEEETRPSEAEPERILRGFVLVAVIFSLCLAQFLAALDITIIATALPTVTGQLHATAAQYTWVGSSYTLASTASTPLWSKCSDIWGRKPLLILANVVFMAGSLQSGLSKTVGMLIAGRTLQGLGGGGILILCTVVMADLFELRKRAKYYGLSAIVWAIASGLGPVLGGVFTQTIGWRWCFYINLPIDAISLFLLAFTLRIRQPKASVIEGLRSFDWIGSVTIVGGTICFLCGLEAGASSQHAWASAFTLGLLIGGVVLLVGFVLYEWRWAPLPIIPMRVFASKSNMAAVSTACLHGFVFISYDFFLPLYFQVALGSTPIQSGLYLFALLLPLSVVSAGTGIYIKRTGNYHIAAWFGATIMTLGTGLFIDLESRLVWWKIIIYQIIAGVGTGTLFLSPMLAFQSHLRQEDVASGTSAFTLLRSLFTAISIVLGGVVLQREGIKNGGLGGSGATQAQNTKRAVTEDDARDYMAALSAMWIFYTGVCAPMLVSAFLISKNKIKSSNETVDEVQETPSSLSTIEM